MLHFQTISFLYDHIWPCVELFSPCLPYNSPGFGVGEIHCRATNGHQTPKLGMVNGVFL